MRKAFIILFALLISANVLYAESSIGLNPWHGGFGVDMASTEYNYDISKIGWISQQSYANGNIPEGTSPYTDTHMIAFGGVWNMESVLEKEWWETDYEWIKDDDNIDAPMYITAECENGFYFESISNPGARRPFKLYIVIKESYSPKEDSYSQSGDTGRTRTVAVKELGDGSNGSNGIYSTDHKYSFLTSGNYESWPNASDKIGHYLGILGPYYYNIDYKFQYMWFDVILCLPYDATQGDNYVTSEGKMTYNNREYTLAEADDYTAIVKITLSWADKAPVEVTIPLRGYYSANIEEQDSTASLSVRPRASAANLSIETMQGVEVPIADIDFMATGYPKREEGTEKIVYDKDGNVEYLNIDNFYMFLSSSRSPFDHDANGFRLVRRGISNPNSPYSEDYLGFTLRVTPTATTGGTNSYVDFDGTKSVPSSGTLEETDKAGMIHITPEENYDTGFKLVKFSQFQGTVSIIMDQATTMMHSGVYEEEIYVHIVTDD